MVAAEVAVEDGVEDAGVGEAAVAGGEVGGGFVGGEVWGVHVEAWIVICLEIARRDE